MKFNKNLIFMILSGIVGIAGSVIQYLEIKDTVREEVREQLVDRLNEDEEGD